MIRYQSLGSEETRALVRARESREEEVELSLEVTLDITNLMEYNGQGKCSVVRCYDDAVPRYREQLRQQADTGKWLMKIMMIILLSKEFKNEMK